MPSTRVSSFVDATVLEAELVPTGTERALPPASRELLAPAGVSERADKRRRREHPAKVGRPSNAEQVEAVNTVFEAMKREIDPSIEDMAAAVGAGQDGRRVKDIMRTAKSALQQAVGEYVEIHKVAAKVAAMKGDSRPAEWALENIAVEGERVVDPPQKNLPPAAPTFNLGFVIGGMPRQQALPANTKE